MNAPQLSAGAARHVLIVGLGNELCGDDGVGVHACRLLAPRVEALAREDVIVAEVGTAVGDALHLLEWADYVLCIDAMQAGGPAGSIYLGEAADLADEERLSLHQLGLRGALELLELEHSAPAPHDPGCGASVGWQRPRVQILGVEPASLRLGLGLSAAVDRALPQVLDHAWQLVERWAQAATGG